MGYGPITEKVRGFKQGVDIVRTQRYGDIWLIRVCLERTDYRWRNTGTSSLEVAQEQAFAVWQSIVRDKEESDSTKTSLSRLFHYFIEHQHIKASNKQLSVRTVESKISGIKNGILPFIAHKGLRNPKRVNSNKDFRDYPDFRLAQGKDPATVNNEIIIIKEAFRWMRREEYIDYDPPYIESCTVNQRKRDESNPPITVDDFLLMKDWLDAYVDEDIKTKFESSHANKLQKRTYSRERYMRQMFRCYVHTCTAAALRMHEWRALTWGMVKVGKENELSIPPETKTGRRLVIYRSDKLKELKDIHDNLPNFTRDKDTLLGVDPNTGGGFSDTTYSIRWKRMMKELDMDYTEYSMRAAGICSRLEAGVPIFTVSRWAGNSVRIIEQNYTASIMRSQRMRSQVLMDEGKKWKAAGIFLGNSDDYVIRDLE